MQNTIHQSSLEVVIITLFLLVLSIPSCDPGDGKLVLINNSKDTIFFKYSADDTIRHIPVDYLDDTVNWAGPNYLLPKAKTNIGILGKWEEGLSRSKDSSLYMFIFSKQLIDSVNKDTILAKQLSTRKIKRSLSDLEKSDWIIEYP